MGLLSIFSKNKQQSSSDQREFYSRAEEETQAARGRGKRKPGKPSKTANESVDPILPEKKRARRRLVGAIALVLAAIIVLPMILDSEPKPLSDDIAIQIPSRDKPASAPDIALSAPNAPVPSSSVAASVPLAASLDQHEQVVQLPATGATTPTDNSANVKTPVPSTHAAQQVTQQNGNESTAIKNKVKEESKHQDAPHIVANEKNEPKPPPKNEHAAENKVENKSEARAEAILEGKDGSDKNDKKATKFVIQVAALTSKDKVDELQGKLSGAGFKSYVEKTPTDSGTWMRVRIGPFANKEEAENARAKLSKIGLSSKLMPS